MAYSIDLRERVVNFVNNGGSKAQSARKYEVSRWCVSDWCKRSDLAPLKVERRLRKLDWEALKRHVQEYPDALLRERAAFFGVNINAIRYALKQMEPTRKKKLYATFKGNPQNGLSTYKHYENM